MIYEKVLLDLAVYTPTKNINPAEIFILVMELVAIGLAGFFTIVIVKNIVKKKRNIEEKNAIQQNAKDKER